MTKERLEYQRKWQEARRKKFPGNAAVAKHMRALRTSKGIKACWVADKMRISTAMLTYLETARRTFSPELQRRYLEAIGGPT